jgi:hypothetical protein
MQFGYLGSELLPSPKFRIGRDGLFVSWPDMWILDGQVIPKFWQPSEKRVFYLIVFALSRGKCFGRIDHDG